MNSAMETFFRNFERHSSSGEFGTLVAQFAEIFMVGGPKGTRPVQADAFALALPERKKMFDEMGRQSTDLISLRETKLNPQYTMVETQWRMTFANGAQSPEAIQSTSTFIVYTGGEELKIVFYLTHQDMIEMLKSRRAAV